VPENSSYFIKYVIKIKLVNSGKSTFTKKTSPITPENIEIRELKKKLSRIEEHNKIVKRRQQIQPLEATLSHA